jgi:uncharacterized protein (DUF697 family)
MNIRERNIDSQSQSLMETFDALIKDPSIPANEKLNVIIHLTALTCALVAVQPIPFADLFILSPIQVVMVIGMSRVLGNPVGKHGAGEIIASVAGVVGWGVLAQQVVLGLYKTVIPFMGAVTTVPLVYGATMALGYATKAILEARSKDQEISQAELKILQEQAKQKAKEENINLETIRTQLSQWRTKAESYQKYQQELESQESNLSQLKQDNQRLKSQLIELQNQQQTRTREFEKKLELLQNQLQEKKQTLEVLEQELKKQTNNKFIEILRQQIINLKAEIDYSVEENSELEQEIKQTKQSYNSLQLQLENQTKQAAEFCEKLKRLTEKRIESLKARINTCYPNLKVSHEVLKQMAQLNNNDIYAVERQFGLLQYDFTKVNFKCTIQGTRKNIQEIQINALRLYIFIEGNEITIVRVGKKTEQTKDISWIQRNY